MKGGMPFAGDAPFGNGKGGGKGRLPGGGIPPGNGGIGSPRPAPFAVIWCEVGMKYEGARTRTYVLLSLLEALEMVVAYQDDLEPVLAYQQRGCISPPRRTWEAEGRRRVASSSSHSHPWLLQHRICLTFCGVRRCDGVDYALRLFVSDL